MSPQLPLALAALLVAGARAATYGDYGTDATCAASSMVNAPHVVWGGACWGSSYQYGLGIEWINGISQGNNVGFSTPHLGNLSVWDAFAITSCEPGSITLGTWTRPAMHPNYCSGAPAQALMLPLNVCKLDTISRTYKMLLDGA